jgi:hypothetical protein
MQKQIRKINQQPVTSVFLVKKSLHGTYNKGIIWRHIGTALIQWNNSHPQNYSESLLRSNWVHPRYLMGVTRSLALCVMFCRSLFVLLYFFFWPLCRLSFDLRILIIGIFMLVSREILHHRLRYSKITINNTLIQTKFKIRNRLITWS